MVKRPNPRAKRFTVIDVLVGDALLAKIDEARGELSRDEWLTAASEAQLARTDLLRQYMGVNSRRRTNRLARKRRKDREGR